MRWFDAHLDLAYLAMCGRDMESPLDLLAREGPHPPAAVTLASLRDGGVAACLATVFTEARQPGAKAAYPAVEYEAGDSASAEAAGRLQMAWYGDATSRGRMRLWRPGCALAEGGAVSVGILVEGADVIASPEDLRWWVDRGVAAVGLTWARGSRYADGNAAEHRKTPRGLTPAGREMVLAMDEAGVVHDASHLSHRAMDELLSLTGEAVMASHSNCLALLERDNERHLRDEHIREIASRTSRHAGGQGVIGLNLCANFIRPGLIQGDRPSVEEAVRHVEHVCEVVGHRRCVGLGSDMDGGFSAEHLPLGINAPRDLVRLAEGLRDRGWNDEDVEGFAWGNWARFWGIGE